MSYSDAALDLSAVPVACLAGQNGAGKSALLDAVTWALWECARSSSDELIRLSCREMWVDVQFIYEGQLYRVRRARQRSVSKSGSKGVTKGSLDIQVLVMGECADDVQEQHHQYASALATAQAESSEQGTIDGAAPGPDDCGTGTIYSTSENRHMDSDGDHCCSTPVPPGSACASFDPRQGKWKSLTGASMRETQKYICELLRMDYDTFVNSAYLRQGKADEFTMRSPSERKQVLGEILGLSYFDRLQEKSREKMRDLKTRKEVLDMSMQSMAEVEQRVSTALSEKADVQALLSATRADLEKQEQSVAHSAERINQLVLRRQRAEDARERTADLQSDIAKWTTDITDLQAKLKELDHLIDQSEAIKHEAARLEACRESVQSLEQKASSFQDLLNERLSLQSQLAMMRSRLEVEHEHAQRVLAENETRLARLSVEVSDKEKVEEAYGQYKDLVTREAELARKQEAHAQLNNRVGELQAAIAESRIRLEAEIAQKQDSLLELTAILESRTLIDEQKSVLEGEANSLDRLEAQFELIEQKGLTIKSDLESCDAQIAEIKRRQKENLEKVAELEQHKDSTICPLCSSPIVDRAAVVNRYRKSNDEMGEEIAQLEWHKSRWQEERVQLRAQYCQMRKKLEGRKDLDKQIGQFNEKIVAIQRAHENQTKLAEALKLLELRLDKQDYAQLERESLIAVKAELHKLDFDPVAYASLQSQLRAQRHIEAKHHQMQKDAAEKARIEQALPGLGEALDAVASRLAGETYGEDVRARLKELQERLSTLGYDRDEHARQNKLFTELMPAAERLSRLERAVSERPAMQQSLESCQQMLDSRGDQLEKLTGEIAQSEDAIKELPVLEQEYDALKPRLNELKDSKDRLSQRLAVISAQLEQHERELSSLIERKIEIEKLDREIDDYQFLVEAFGKKGIQAVIIENALPEMESDANRILSRLTDNKMHIALETQHKTKAGGVVETLDLLIGDEIGTRSYELYSGGEAFKVNFAVRVALSRLLARRSGAKLETLIIDEGFGSQDESSRERLVRAIRSIQSDFARILVITHMSDIKDMFPVQIQVTKQNGTSRLQVVA